MRLNILAIFFISILFLNEDRRLKAEGMTKLNCTLPQSLPSMPVHSPGFPAGQALKGGKKLRALAVAADAADGAAALKV